MKPLQLAASAPAPAPAPPTDAKRVLGNGIRRLRRRHGWTLETLSQRSGVSYQYLSEIECGRQNFSIGILEQIAAGLGLSPVEVVVAAYGEHGGSGL